MLQDQDIEKAIGMTKAMTKECLWKTMYYKQATEAS
jgi:hypothetical protein